MEQQITGYSCELQDVIGRSPSWLTKWGIMIIVFVLLIVITLSSFLDYPEKVNVKMTIYSTDMPKEVVSPRSCRIDKILVDDGQYIIKGQPIAYLESAADHYEVLKLKQTLDTLITKFKKNYSGLSDTQMGIETYLELGDLQEKYEYFYEFYLTYLETLRNGNYQLKLNDLHNDILGLSKLKKELINLKRLHVNEFNNQKKDFEAFSMLVRQKVVSPNEFRSQENKFLASQMPILQDDAALVSNSTASSNKEREIKLLEKDMRLAEAKFGQQLKILNNEVKKWISENVLTASCSGILSYQGVLEDNQYKKINETLFVINPRNAKYYGEIQIFQENIGKVSVGQKTVIKVKGFPTNEYGALEGKITKVSDYLWHDSIYLAKVSFLKPSFRMQKSIRLKPGMKADAEIITKNCSVLSRLLRNFLKSNGI